MISLIRILTGKNKVIQEAAQLRSLLKIAKILNYLADTIRRYKIFKISMLHPLSADDTRRIIYSKINSPNINPIPRINVTSCQNDFFGSVSL